MEIEGAKMLYKLLKKEEERQLLEQIKKKDSAERTPTDINLSLVMAEGKKVAQQKEYMEKQATLRGKLKESKPTTTPPDTQEYEAEGKSPVYTTEGSSVDSITY